MNGIVITMGILSILTAGFGLIELQEAIEERLKKAGYRRKR